MARAAPGRAAPPAPSAVAAPAKCAHTSKLILLTLFVAALAGDANAQGVDPSNSAQNETGGFWHFAMRDATGAAEVGARLGPGQVDAWLQRALPLPLECKQSPLKTTLESASSHFSSCSADYLGWPAGQHQRAAQQRELRHPAVVLCRRASAWRGRIHQQLAGSHSNLPSC